MNDDLFYEWKKPESLDKPNAVPFPVDALPDFLIGVVDEISEITMAPIPLIVSSVLSGMSTVCQTHVDVERPVKGYGDRWLRSPVSLFFLSVAVSGERKSTVDGYVTNSIHSFDELNRETYERDKARFNADWTLFTEKQNAIISDMRKALKSSSGAGGHDENFYRDELEKLEVPEKPFFPRYVYTNFTIQRLLKDLAFNFPSCGLLTSEGGVLFGGYAMSREQSTGSMAILNTLWDGRVDPKDIKDNNESIPMMTGCRCTASIMVQPAVIEKFLNANRDVAEGSGFLARFLICAPESTRGTRIRDIERLDAVDDESRDSFDAWSADDRTESKNVESEKHVLTPFLNSFNSRMTHILNLPVPFNVEKSNRQLLPEVMRMNDRAAELWWRFYEFVEINLYRKFSAIAGAADKAAENAARMATVLAFFENPDSRTIQEEHIRSACIIVEWYLNEGVRIAESLNDSEELMDAKKLIDWLVSRCLKFETIAIPKNDVQKYVSTRALRQADRLDRAINLLIDRDIIHLTDRHDKEGRKIKQQVYINAHLIPDVYANYAARGKRPEQEP